MPMRCVVMQCDKIARILLSLAPLHESFTADQGTHDTIRMSDQVIIIDRHENRKMINNYFVNGHYSHEMHHFGVRKH